LTLQADAFTTPLAFDRLDGEVYVPAPIEQLEDNVWPGYGPALSLYIRRNTPVNLIRLTLSTRNANVQPSNQWNAREVFLCQE
jgi:hypothetical protein